VPDDVLGEAERALPETERALDALLAAVEERARALEAKEREVTAAAEAARAERERIEARAVEVAARAKALDKAGREQARAYLLEARKIVEAALSRARAAVDEATAKEARRLLEQAIEQTAGDEAGKEAGEKAGEGGTGKGKGWISLDELKRQRRVPSPTARPPDRPTAAVAAIEISLLGLRKDEAEPVLVKALDDAVLADLPYLRIIHGKGTGVLRQLVHDLLSQDPRVKRFGFAPREQGGAGVTIAEFTA
jgi:DNA mismatch repair protein MutS2